MKHWTASWSGKILFGLLIFCMCCGESLCRKRKPQRLGRITKPRALNETYNSTNGGKNTADDDLAMEQPRQHSGILNLGCYGIKIKRYVSNGFCTSRRAIRDTICEGRCLDMSELPWFPEFSKIISKRKREWRCVPDRKRRRKITFTCNDGTKRRYRVLVVRSCKCKRYTRKQNMTNPPGQQKKGSRNR